MQQASDKCSPKTMALITDKDCFLEKTQNNYFFLKPSLVSTLKLKSANCCG